LVNSNLMLIGHSKIYERLLEDAKAGRLHHAQLFLGPKHVGKTRVALKLAMHLQCPDDSQIVIRKQIIEGADADTLLFLDDGEVIPIEKIRQMIARTGLTHLRPYLIVIIENIGRMKIETMNALLKTLEEPPPGVLFFLTANKEEDIIPTIRSRVQVSNFSTVSDKNLMEVCKEKPFANEIVMFALGRPGKLLRLMEDPEYFAAHQQMYYNLNGFLENPSTSAVFSLLREYEKNELLQEMLDILLHRIRTYALSGKSEPMLAHLDFTLVLEEIESVKYDLKRQVNKRLLLENLLLPFAP